MFDKARGVVILLVVCNCALGVFPFELEQAASQLVGGSAGAVVGAASLPQSFRQHHHHRLLLQDAIIVPSPQGASPKPPPKQDGGRGLNPSVVIIVVILTVVFLLSGFLHLLARCCGRVAARREPTESAMSAIHGQLQQLFQLHDSGVDQAFIDTLPVFPYKAICGLKEGTDCAVCLSEFENEDRLRLLPKCKHAFHIDCIDTWLLSHSTCPLCRCALLSDEAAAGNAGYSDSDRLGSTRSMRSDGYAGDSRRTSNMSRRNVASSSMLAEHGGGSGSDLGKEEDARMMGGLGLGLGMDSPEIQPVIDRSDSEASVASVLSVKLGRVERKKTKRKDIMGSSILRGRSYSMGSYEYVVDPANLQVIIAPTPYPGRGNSREFTYDGRPRHRTVFSDGIPELGSIPGTPADELFWATRGLATPQYGDIREGMGTPDFLNARTPDFLTSRTPDFVASKDEGRDGNGAFRLNLGHLASEASLVPREHQHIEEDEREQDAATLGSESTGSTNSIGNVSVRSGGRGSDDALDKEWETIDLKEVGHVDSAEVGSTSLQQQQQHQRPNAKPPLSREAFGERGSGSESEESRVMAGLERFFGTGWRSNVGLEKLAESMSRRDKTPLDGLSLRSSLRSKSEHGAGGSIKDHHSVSSRAFSFRFPVPESLAKLGRSRRSLSDTTAALISKESAAAASTTTTTTFETASKDTTTGYETASKAGSKEAGFETASKESLGGLDSSSVGSFDSSWIPPPVQQGPPSEENVVVNHNEANQQASSLARKTIHWLMGRDRRVQVHAANFSPAIASGSNSLRNNDEN